jgi:uncharacterized protein (DUF1684 family)
MRKAFLGSVTAILLAALATVSVTQPSAAQDGEWQQALFAWRTQHVADLTKPDGWLSLAGLEWLQPGDNSFGSATDNKIHLAASVPAHIAILHLEGTTVQLLAPKSGFPKDFQVAGQAAQPQSLPAEVGNDQVSPHLTVGTLNMYVIRRSDQNGDRFALRIKDSQSVALKNFHGLSWFAPNVHYHVTAQWIPYSPHKSITLATLVGTSYNADVPGAVEFSLNGKTYRVEPVLEDPNVPTLFFILRDTTSTTTTYAACRFLYTGLPTNGLDEPGELILDFNHLENPPCAYTQFSTCPLPPLGNRLPIPLPVGEKRYHD